ncbi:MAG TPA: lipid-A-disaccharide synthase [Candidatus Brocadiia bacterium]|nr:lipid-A-disaccharide synthase [Candidatus Brocadiales bacterium]
MKIFISAGEASGDVHGANLILALKKLNPSVETYGLGKERMIDAGLHCLHDMGGRSVMWLHGLTKIVELWRIYSDCVKFFDKHVGAYRNTPLLVILIDYCGFNFHLARAAKKRGIPVMYYISPQLWAHGPWRTRKIKKLVDKMVVIYPFEEEFYRKAGIPVKYVGHPLFDEIAKESALSPQPSAFSPHDSLIALLPGSRVQEVKRLMPLFLKAAERILKVMPSAKFVISCSEEAYRGLIENIVHDFLRRLSASGGAATLPYEIVVGNISEVIKASTLCITSSGTITLEIASHLVPMIICYRLSPISYFIANPHIPPYISLVNKLADSEIVPEALMYRDDAKWIASHALDLICDEEKREKHIEGLRLIKELIGEPGASFRAAEEAMRMCV